MKGVPVAYKEENMGEVSQGTILETEGTQGSTQSKAEPTAKTYSEKELQSAVSKGLESITKQLSLRDAELKSARATTEAANAQIASRQATIDALHKEVEDALEDDPEKRKEYLSRIRSLERVQSLAEKEKRLAEKEADIERKSSKAEQDILSTNMVIKSIELRKKYQVPQGVIDACTTVEMMETIAKEFPEVGEKEEAKSKPRFDSVVSTGVGGETWRKLSPQQQIQYGIEQRNK